MSIYIGKASVPLALVSVKVNNGKMVAIFKMQTMLILLAYNTLTGKLSKKHPCINWRVVYFYIEQYGNFRYKYVVMASSSMNEDEEKDYKGRVLSKVEQNSNYIVSDLI